MESIMTAVHSLVSFAQTRPRLDFANYGDVRAYRSDARGITRDLRAVRELANVARYRCTDDEVLQAARGGRVEITPYADETGAGYRISYCAGQYYPVEYRAAVARVLASALWRAIAREVGDRPDACSQIRRQLRAELSLSVYRRFFL
jgi:hypothetical protein